MEQTGDDPYFGPYIWIFGWEDAPYSLKIKFDNSKYKIYFRETPKQQEYDLINILENYGMQYTGYDILGFEIVKSSASDTAEFVEKLCTELQNITLWAKSETKNE